MVPNKEHNNIDATTIVTNIATTIAAAQIRRFKWLFDHREKIRRIILLYIKINY
jgi:hypothetical protein